MCTGVLLGDLIAALLSSGDFGHIFFQSRRIKFQVGEV